MCSIICVLNCNTSPVQCALMLYNQKSNLPVLKTGHSQIINNIELCYIEYMHVSLGVWGDWLLISRIPVIGWLVSVLGTLQRVLVVPALAGSGDPPSWCQDPMEHHKRCGIWMELINGSYWLLRTQARLVKFPGHSYLQYLIAYSMQLRRGEAWEILWHLVMTDDRHPGGSAWQW